MQYEGPSRQDGGTKGQSAKFSCPTVNKRHRWQQRQWQQRRFASRFQLLASVALLSRAWPNSHSTGRNPQRRWLWFNKNPSLQSFHKLRVLDANESLSIPPYYIQVRQQYQLMVCDRYLSHVHEATSIKSSRNVLILGSQDSSSSNALGHVTKPAT